MESSKLQDIRDWFDELFLWVDTEISDKSQQLFETLWISGLANIILKSKTHWFHASQKVLADLVKISWMVYQNIDNLPLHKKVILPQQSWSYKFIVTSLPHPLLRGSCDPVYADIDTSTILLISTWDDMHAKIAAKIWLPWIVWDLTVLWWARIDIDYTNKTLHIHHTSGKYWSCCNQTIEWLLEEYAQQWYTITIWMDEQHDFFSKQQ